MLEPRDRQLLFDCLRPPPGYRFDRGVATTYSLDLLALLTLPLAFTMFDSDDEEGRPQADPHALLEALRRHASHLSMFCQAGQIKVPKLGQLLFSYLEASVFQATAPHGGVFHPKVTVLRYVPLDTQGLPGDSQQNVETNADVRYRFLCASRNLVFDRCWDTVLALDGRLVNRQRAFSRNRPLHEFVAALPKLAIRPLPSSNQTEIEQIADELLRVDFELPEGFKDLAFWPLGHAARSVWPFTGRMDRVLVISPFLADGALRRISASSAEKSVLVSRHEALDELTAETVRSFGRTYYLSADAEVGAAEADGIPSDDNTTTDGEIVPDELRGLHAKLIVADAGWDARLWVGSANATDAAFNINVEFLVELTGTKSQCGVDAILGSNSSPADENIAGRTRLIDLFEPYERQELAPQRDALRKELEAACQELRQQLAAAGLDAQVTLAVDSSPDIYDLRILRAPENAISLPADASLRCWPITIADAAAVVPNFGESQPVAQFKVSFKAITSFFAFEVMVRRRGQKLISRFVLNLPLRGAPDDRQDRILLSLLENRRQVLRYLLMLLAEDGATMIIRDFAPAGHGVLGESGNGFSTVPLLESLLSTLERQPNRLDQVARLVDDLRRTAEGRALLPERFDEIWEAIWEARRGRPNG